MGLPESGSGIVLGTANSLPSTLTLIKSVGRAEGFISITVSAISTFKADLSNNPGAGSNEPRLQSGCDRAIPEKATCGDNPALGSLESACPEKRRPRGCVEYAPRPR